MRRLVIGSVIGLFLAVVGVMTFVDRKYDTPQPETPSTSAPYGIAAKDPSELQARKLSADRTLRRFVDAFYSRPAELLEGSVQERTARYISGLEPYVTKRFLELYVYPLNTKLDEDLARMDGTVKAAVSRFGVGHGHSDSLDKEVRIRSTTKWPGRTTQKGEITVIVYMTYSGDMWRVEALEVSS